MKEGEKEVGIWVPSKRRRKVGVGRGRGDPRHLSDCYGNISKAFLLNVVSDQLPKKQGKS